MIPWNKSRSGLFIPGYGWENIRWQSGLVGGAASSRASANSACWSKGSVDYAIYMLDPDGIITNWNAGAERIKGYDAGEVVGQHFQMFYPPEDREAGIACPLPRNGSARTARFEAEGWRVRKDGRDFLCFRRD